MEQEFKNHSVFTVQIILGLIFFAAGASKITDPAGFAKIISNYQILPEYLINETAFFLPYLEICISIMLFSGLCLTGASIISFLMILTFTAALIFNMARGINVSCGCFTSTINQVTDIHYIYYILRDIIFLFIAGYFTKNMLWKK